MIQESYCGGFIENLEGRWREEGVVVSPQEFRTDLMMVAEDWVLGRRSEQ